MSIQIVSTYKVGSFSNVLDTPMGSSPGRVCIHHHRMAILQNSDIEWIWMNVILYRGTRFILIHWMFLMW